VFGLGSKAWVVLFKTDPDFKQVASSVWVSGVIMSTLSAILIGLFFKSGSLYDRRLVELDARQSIFIQGEIYFAPWDGCLK
jgi:hypothetical protein